MVVKKKEDRIIIIKETRLGGIFSSSFLLLLGRSIFFTCTSILGTRLTSKGHSGFCLSWDQRSGGVYGLLLLLLLLWDFAFALAFCPFFILVIVVSQFFTCLFPPDFLPLAVFAFECFGECPRKDWSLSRHRAALIFCFAPSLPCTFFPTFILWTGLFAFPALSDFRHFRFSSQGKQKFSV